MKKECEQIIEMAEGPSVCVDEYDENPEHFISAVREEVAYGIKVRVSKPYDQAVSSVRESLAREGLDILSEINVQKLFQDKLGQRYPRYTILGVNSAELLHRALDHDQDVGLLMPCNVVIYEHGADSVVEAVDPIALFAIADGGGLRDVSLDIKQRLQTAIDHVASGLA